MTDAEAIAAVRAGKRCETSTTIAGLTPPVVPEQWKCRHRWRAVACDFETDVVECQDCGEQRLATCNFFDDVS